MSQQDLIEFSRARLAHVNQRRLLQEKYQARMIFAHAGGMWRAGPDLQVTLMTCPDSTAVLPDLYDNPVRVDTTDLMQLSCERWQEQMTAWLIELESLQQQR